MEVNMRGVLSFVFVLALCVVGGNVTRADDPADHFGWVIFPDFCAPASSCPDVSTAANGDTIQMAGTGKLSFHPKSVAGGGTFTHRDSAGAVIETGTWTAIELLSFDDYGTTPGAPPTFHGGDALMRVHLTPRAGGPGVDALLDVVCALGDPPPGHQEGIRLAVNGGPNFNDIVTGATVFIAL
jgi:hypothetical protein